MSVGEDLPAADVGAVSAAAVAPDPLARLNPAQRAAVVHARYGEGGVVLFAINPVWRGSTVGSYPLLFNAILQRDAPYRVG